MPVAGGRFPMPLLFFIKQFSSPRFKKTVSGFSWTNAFGGRNTAQYSMQEMKMALMDNILASLPSG